MKKVKSFSLLFVLVSVSLINPGCASGQQNNSKSQKKSTEIKMPVIKAADEENYLNTVTTTDTYGKRYKLVIIGDLLPKFYVNDRLLNNTELANYNSTIEKLTPVLWQRQKQAGEEKKALFEKNTKAIVNEIIQQGIFKNATDIESFCLTANAFMVNDKNLSFETFNYFKNKYIKSADDVYYFNKTSN